jgi:hypothetical protein
MMDPDSISISDLSVADASVMLAKLACVTRMLKQADGPAPDPSIMGTLKGWGSDIANNWTTPSKLIDNPLAMAGGGAAAGGLLGAGSSMLNDEEDQHPFRNAITGALAGGLGGLGMQQALHYGGKVQDSIQHPETNPDGTETLGAGRGKYDASVAKRDNPLTYSDKATQAAKNVVGYGAGIKGMRMLAKPEFTLRTSKNPFSVLNKDWRIQDTDRFRDNIERFTGPGPAAEAVKDPIIARAILNSLYTSGGARTGMAATKLDSSPPDAEISYLNQQPDLATSPYHVSGGSKVSQRFLDGLRTSDPTLHKAIWNVLSTGRFSNESFEDHPVGDLPSPSVTASMVKNIKAPVWQPPAGKPDAARPTLSTPASRLLRFIRGQAPEGSPEGLWDRTKNMATEVNKFMSENKAETEARGSGGIGRVLNYAIPTYMGYRAWNNTPRTKDYADAVQEIIKQRPAASPSLLDYMKKHPGDE